MILVYLALRALGKLAFGALGIVEDALVIVELKRRGSMRETYWRRW